MAKQQTSMFGMELPSPLDKAEEERLLQDFHENRQIFLERNLRLVLHIAKKYDVNQSDLKELFSVGEMGLIKAVNTFNPGKEIKFATYASRCIENEIGMFLRHEKKHQLPSIDKPLVIDESGKELTYSDVIEDERSSNFQENLLNQELSSTILEIALNKLSYKEQVIFLAMLSGKTQKNIAEILGGYSQSYISRLEDEIIKKMKMFLKLHDKVGMNFEKKFSAHVSGDIVVVTFYTNSTKEKDFLKEKVQQHQCKLLTLKNEIIRIKMYNSPFQIMMDIIISLHNL